MNAPLDWVEIMDGKRYDVSKSELIADNAYWDGNNWERHGRNEFLYKTKNGNYFAVTLTRWQGERDRLEPLSLDNAIDTWEQLPEKHCSFEEAFPGVEIEDA